VAGGPGDDGVERTQVVFAGEGGAAAEGPVLVEGDADDVAAPVEGVALEFAGREGGGEEEAVVAGLAVFEAGAVEAAQEEGLAAGGDGELAAAHGEPRQ